MIQFDQYQAQTILRQQSEAVEITNSRGVTLSTVEPKEALDLMIRAHNTIATGDPGIVRFLRRESGAKSGDWTGPAADSVTSFKRKLNHFSAVQKPHGSGIPVRPERREFDPRRSWAHSQAAKRM